MNYREIYKEKNFGKIIFDEPMKNHTSFGIGGPSDVFILPTNENELIDVLKFNYENKIPTTVIGRGTNLLVSDKGIRGAVICLADNYSNVEIDGTKVSVLSGTSLKDCALKAIENSLSGMEEVSGIPGNVGGAVAMNAGAYNREIKDFTISVRLINKKGEIIEYNNEQMNFSYRHSRVFDEDLIVSSAVFQLEKGDYNLIKERYLDFTNRRETKQPLDKKSCGSTFKRPTGSYASKLIDESGLRGYSYKDCQVSEKHCGFIMNNGNATCEEMLYFIDKVKEIVKEKTGFDLEREVKLIGEF